MKTLKSLLIFPAVLMAVLIFSRCTFPDDIDKISDSVDSLQVMLSTPKFNTIIHFEFIDAKTNEPIEDNDVSITISGRDADYVYNNIGSKQESYSSFWGMLDLVVDPHKVDTTSIQTNPIHFEVNVAATGYVSNYESVVVSNPKVNQVVIALQKINDLPEGVEIYLNDNVTYISSSGELDEDVNIVFGEENPGISNELKSLIVRNNTLAGLSIPKGTILLGRNGEPLSSGYLSISCNLDNFPQNGNLQNLIYWYSPLNKQNMWFQKTGKVLWTLFVGSNEVFSFKNGIVVSQLYLPSNFINPSTNQLVKVDDVLEKIEWRKTSPNDIKKDIIKYSKVKNDLILVDSLTNKDPVLYNSWVFQWGHYVPTCSKQLLFEFTGDNVYTKDAFYKHKIFKDQKLINGLIADKLYFTFDGTVNSKQLLNLPEGRTEHKFEDYITNKDYNLVFTPSELVLDNSCENKVYKISVTDVPKSGVEFVSVNLSVSLENKSLVIKPNLFIIYKASSEKNVNRYLELNNGKGSFKLKVGEKYLVGSLIGKTKAEGQITVDIENETTYKVTFTPFSFGSSSGGSAIIERGSRTTDRTVDIDFKTSVNESTFNLFQ